MEYWQTIPGLIVLYGVNAAANASMACKFAEIYPETSSQAISGSRDTDLHIANEWKDDPRNPNAKPKGKQ